MGLWASGFRRQFQIQHEDNTFEKPNGGCSSEEPQGAESARSGPSFSLLLRRSALSLIFTAIMAFKAPWRRHFCPRARLLCGPSAGRDPALDPSGQRIFKSVGDPEASLSFLFGFPVAATLLVVDLDLTSAWARGAASLPEIVWLNAAVILAYAVWAGFFCSEGQTARAANSLLITAECMAIGFH